MHTLKSVLSAGLVVVLFVSFAWSQDACDLAGPPTGSYPVGGGTYSVRPGDTLIFTIHFTVVSDAVKGGTNGYRVYISDQPNGSTTLNPGPGFVPAYFYRDLIDFSRYWDGGWFVSGFSQDGLGADTIRTGGFSLFKPGIPIGFDQDAYTLRSGTYAATGDQGYYLCLDSSWYPAGGAWLWSTNSGNQFPYWGGPYCYEIKTCCIGSQGNVDGSPDGMVTVSDLTALVFYIFPPHTAIPCEGAGNVDGQTVGGTPINVADVTHLIAYLFQGGPAPVACGN